MPVELEWAFIILSLMLGGILKGATGVEAPILAVPAMASVFGVPFAIAIMVLPNFVLNVWQIWRFRHDAPERGFLLMLLGGGAGVLMGTFMLTALPGQVLSFVVGLLLVVYIAMRLARPDWAIKSKAANCLATPVALVGGVLQGTTGLSAPVTITFLNALQQPRRTFVFTISTLFTGFGVVQMPALFAIGVLNGQRLALSALAVLPMIAAMPLGAWIARRLPAAMFDRAIMIILAGMAIKLLVESLS